MFNIYEALSTGAGKAVALVVALAVGFAAEGFLESLLSGSSSRAELIEITTILVDDHHSIVVNEHAPAMTDVRLMICSLLKDGDPVIEDAVFGMTKLEPHNLEFQLVEASDGDLFGVVEVSNPELLIVTWQLSETSAEIYDVGLTDAAIAQLTAQTETFARENPSVRYEHLSLKRQQEFGQSGSTRPRGMIW